MLTSFFLLRASTFTVLPLFKNLHLCFSEEVSAFIPFTSLFNCVFQKTALIFVEPKLPNGSTFLKLTDGTYLSNFFFKKEKVISFPTRPILNEFKFHFFLLSVFSDFLKIFWKNIRNTLYSFISQQNVISFSLFTSLQFKNWIINSPLYHIELSQ